MVVVALRHALEVVIKVVTHIVRPPVVAVGVPEGATVDAEVAVAAIMVVRLVLRVVPHVPAVADAHLAVDVTQDVQDALVAVVVTMDAIQDVALAQAVAHLVPGVARVLAVKTAPVLATPTVERDVEQVAWRQQWLRKCV